MALSVEPLKHRRVTHLSKGRRGFAPRASEEVQLINEKEPPARVAEDEENAKTTPGERADQDRSGASRAWRYNRKRRDFELSLLKKPSREYPVPWGTQWPQVLDYYATNKPDFSGCRMYNTDNRYVPAYAIYAQKTHGITVQILLSETARVYNRAPESKLLFLKQQTITMLNEILRDPAQNVSVDVIATIVALAIVDLVYGPGREAHGHLRFGIARMINLIGGPQALQQAPAIELLVLYTDAMHSYLTGYPRYLHHDPIEYHVRYRPDHPLRQVIQPRNSNLPEFRMRNHLLMSFAGPLQHIFRVFFVLTRLATETLAPPYRIGPEQAKLEMDSAEEHLFIARPGGGLDTLPTDIFSDQDRSKHTSVTHFTRLVAHALLDQLRHMLSSDPLLIARRDHSVMKFFLMRRDLIDDPAIIAWGFFMVAPYADTAIRELAVDTLARNCRDLGLPTWTDVKLFLDTYYFCPLIQEADCLELWREVESQMLSNLEEYAVVRTGSDASPEPVNWLVRSTSPEPDP